MRLSHPLSSVAALTFALALVAAACGSNGSESGHTPPLGSAADAGQAGDGALAGSGGSGASGSGATGGAISVGGTAGAAANGSGATGGTSATGGASATGGTSATGGAAGLGTGTTACDNGIDDDGDGLIDGLDPECTGAFDNDEGSFATGIPGDNKDPKWQDCFFDGNSGSGDDGCRYPTSCLYGDTVADDPACAVSQDCIAFCGARTPNGCDCFGCCTVQTADGSVDIYTASSCSLDKIDDEAACPRCVKSIGCENPCGECELCPGKTVADLPASCTPPDTGTGGAGGTGGTGGTGSAGAPDGTGGTGGTPPPPAYTCDNGEQVCGPGLPACPAGLYCEQGCCLVVVR